MDRSLTDTVRHVPVRYSAAVLVLAAGLFLLTAVVEVTIIVESPALGDISDAVWLFSQAVSLVLGVAASIITIYNYVGSAESTDQGPVDEITIEGDFHVHLGDPEFTESDSSEKSTDDEVEDESTSSPDDG